MDKSGEPVLLYFSDSHLDALADADGVALRREDHAVEGIADDDNGQFLGAGEVAAEEVARHVARRGHAETDGGGQVGKLAAVVLKALPFFLAGEEQQDGTTPRFECGALFLQVVEKWLVTPAV